MRLLVTAGPTREYIDTVRFITNASSGQMGCAVAAAGVAAGHDVNLLTGPLALSAPAGCTVASFVSVTDLRRELESRFEACDALVMAAAVGDFRVEAPLAFKAGRRDGPITLRLVPTEDILAALTKRKRPDQVVVAFAVEEGTCEQMERKARGKMADKGADFIVINAPAAIGSGRSRACVLSRDGVVLPWADRPKEQLAVQIVALLGGEERPHTPP
jgi:phosphopantothenoylcysteine decarboxylase/phosphopantothenate--cysteine ligase